MYLLIDDASVAQKVRDVGFCVIQTRHNDELQFLVLYSEELMMFMNSNFSEKKFYKTDTVCF